MKDEKCKIKDPASYKSNIAGWRVHLLRLFLITPILAWSFVSDQQYVEIVAVVGAILYVVILGWLERKD